MTSALRLSRRSTPTTTAVHHRLLPFLRHTSTVPTTTTKPSHHKDHIHNHKYLNPTDFISSWTPPSDPKLAEKKLAELRRDYAKQVKEVRKQYIYEMEMQRQEKIRKDEALRQEVLRQREERKKSKLAAAKARAAERMAFDEEFRRTLMKERAEKLEYWRTREKAIEEKRKSEKELIRKQSSMWIDEDKLEKELLYTVMDTSEPNYTRAPQYRRSF